MTPSHDELNTPDLDALVAEYLRSIDAGAEFDRAEFLAAHPEQAAGLNSFFRDLDGMAEFHGGANRSDGIAPLNRIRYFGDYELQEEIARGGMGVVYKARQVSLNRVVALKMIQAGRIAAPEDVRRFHVEAEAAANLDHPHILPVYEVGEHEGLHYFTMKLAEGDNLSTWLVNHRRVDDKSFIRQAAGILLAVAQAVHFAHQRGILHRDLKPANILLDAKGRPFVADFGLAKQTTTQSSLTATGAILGTPSYMPPEQARPKGPLTTAADVYALGAILYEMLTGRPPFVGPTFMDTVMLVLEQEPVQPHLHNRRADRDLSVIALKCLQKDPMKRYGSAGELADDLERRLKNEPILARPVGTYDRLRLWIRRKPVAAVSSAVGGLGLILVMASSIYPYALIAEERSQIQQDREIVKIERWRLTDEHKYLKWNVIRTYLREAESKCRKGDAKAAWAALQALPEPDRHWEWHYWANRCTTDIAAANKADNLQWKHRLPAPLPDRPSDLGDWKNRLPTPFPDRQPDPGDWKPRLPAPFPDRPPSFPDRQPDPGDPLHRYPPLLIFDIRSLGVRKCELSPDGKWLALACRDNTVRIWDMHLGKVVKTLTGHSGAVNCVTFSHDGTTIASGEDNGTICLWGVSGALQTALNGHSSAVTSLVFSKDDRSLVSGSVRDPATRNANEQFVSNLLLWDLSTRKAREFFHSNGKNGDIRKLAMSMDGNRLAVLTDSSLELWNTRTGQVSNGPIAARLRESTSDIQSTGTPLTKTFALSPGDGSVACVGGNDGIHYLLNSVNLADIGSDDLPFSSLCWHASPISGVAFSPDGNRIATCCADHHVRIWDVASRMEVLWLDAHDGPIDCLRFSPNGERLISVGDDGFLRVWSGYYQNDSRLKTSRKLLDNIFRTKRFY